MEWRRTSFIVQNLLEDQNGAIENLGSSPQIQPKFGLLKIVKLTAKTIHVNYQMQQDKVVHPMPMHKS